MGNLCNKKLQHEMKDSLDNSMNTMVSTYSSNKTVASERKGTNSSLSISKNDFIEIKLIGKGSYGKVLLVKKKSNDKLYAMKILEKSLIKLNRQEDHTKTERDILEKIEHPFIVKLYYAFQSSMRLYLITEFMQGGDYFYHLRRERKFSEDKTRFYMAEIVLALEYLHKNNYIYRDLKPENVLMGLDGHIKLTDFGLSKLINSDNKAYTICGTAEYLAPEILLEKGYDRSVDWWSLGVLTFESLTGFSPLKAGKNSRTEYTDYAKKIDLTPYHFWSKEARSLISGLLEIDPKKRLGAKSAEEVKSHPFFQNVNWKDMLEKKVKPPLTPYVNDEQDLGYFDKLFTDENISDLAKPELNKNINVYEGFTYVQPNSLNKENNINNI
jgi:serine/threonine protein kinase